MNDRTSTFAGRLNLFSKAVGIVDDHTLDRVREIVFRYLKNELNASYFELMLDQTVAGKPGLVTFWSSDGRNHAHMIRNEDDQFSTMMATSFVTGKPLWVISRDQAPLRDASMYEDLWSGVVDLPMYTPSSDRPAKTLIVVPLYLRRVLGVFYLETASYVELTGVAARELELLAQALAILLELWEVNRLQSRMTQEAILDLGDMLAEARFPRLAKPSIFVAYSDTADVQVVNVIQEVLQEFSDRFEIMQWNRMSDVGSITVQIANAIAKSKFGICYLSEPAKEATTGYRYVDNPNVVFEAGMLHALMTSTGTEASGWIPVREEDSPPAPFDFATERIQRIPRTLGGELNEALLRAQLQRRMRMFLAEEA